ncbi:MAG TPA: L-2-hydroxyglutarate oxidase [Acidimicrobiia bacterium]
MKGDLAVIGGGLIGLATARAYLEERPGASVTVFEKEARLAGHQSGHSSGVIHSGLYYRPGSLKARLAVAGAEEMYRFVEAEGIGFARSGKLVIAVSPRELPALDELERRGHANGLAGLRRIGSEEITEIEPAATGLAALHVPAAGVTDFVAVAERLAARLAEQGVVIRTGTGVTGISERGDHVEVVAGGETHRFENLVNCAGLQSDRVAAMAGVDAGIRIVPFRGEYFNLVGPLSERVRASIYPVPDPRYPFLGVHFTRGVDGSVHVGPNAVLALGREQYRGERPNLADIAELIRFGGFWRLAAQNIPAGAREMVSRWRRLYARQARRLVPGVTATDLGPGGAGIRAQAVDRRGKLVDDFVIERSDRAVHVLNAPSPGATASLAIGRHIAKVIALGAR